jgi:hypothetical protein
MSNFKKYFKEPKEDYILMSTVLFVPESYKKWQISKTSSSDIKNYKHNKYTKNLLETSKLLLTNYYPSNFYLRIYYDDSIFLDKKITSYPSILKKLKHHPKIQLVKFKFPKFMYKGRHLNLFGTIIRFHALFEDNNAKIVYFRDLDEIDSNKLIQDISNFKNSSFDILTYSILINSSIYRNDFNYKKKTNEDYYFHAGSTIIKKNKKIFKVTDWDYLLKLLTDDVDYKNHINYLDFRKNAIKMIENKNNGSLNESYMMFTYGADKILLNYYLKKKIKKNNMKVYCIFFANLYKKKISESLYDKIKFLIERFNFFINYNSKVNKLNYNIFSKLFVDTFKVKLDIYIKNMNDDKLDKLIEFLQKNIKILEKMYMQSTILYYILNYKKLKINAANLVESLF